MQSSKAASGGNLPQTTVVSLYGFFEKEIRRLGLFDPKTSAGKGIPDMGEDQW